jgi:hypothetical protein
MLHHPTLDKLTTLRLNGMHKALREHLAMPEIEQLTFEERLPRGPRHPYPARPRQGADHTAGHRRLDPRGTQCGDPRPHRRGKDLDRLRALPPGLSPRLHHPLLARPPAVRGPVPRPCRWAPAQADGLPRQDRPDRARRLGARPPRCHRPARSSSIVESPMNWRRQATMSLTFRYFRSPGVELQVASRPHNWPGLRHRSGRSFPVRPWRWHSDGL